MTVETSIFDPALTTDALRKAYLGGDSLVNTEPVHSATRDLNAESWNKLVAAVAEIAGVVGAAGGGAFSGSVMFAPTEASPEYNASVGELVVVTVGDATPGTVNLPTVTSADDGKLIAVQLSGDASPTLVQCFWPLSIYNGYGAAIFAVAGVTGGCGIEWRWLCIGSHDLGSES